MTAERRCRLRGNLLFYFKSGDPGSQPAGLLVLENVRVKLDNSDIDGTFGLIIISGQTKIQHLRSYTREDRDSWKTAIEAASYFTTRARLESLKNHIAKRREAEPPVSPSLGGERSLRDPNQSALLSCRFSCEIPSDRRGQPLSVRSVITTFFSFSSSGFYTGRLVVLARNQEEEPWQQIGWTEFSNTQVLVLCLPRLQMVVSVCL